MSLMYRVETADPDIEDRRGAYCMDRSKPNVFEDLFDEDCIADVLLSCEYDIMVHPNIRNDGGFTEEIRDLRLAHMDGYRFGFSTLKQYHSWFHKRENHEKLLDHVVLSVYEVPDDHLHVGWHQCIAEVGCMEHVCDLPITYEEHEFQLPLDIPTLTAAPESAGYVTTEVTV